MRLSNFFSVALTLSFTCCVPGEGGHTAPLVDATADPSERVEVDASAQPELAYELQTVIANGLAFSVWIAGPPEGEPVILLHGFPQSSYQWRHLARALVAQGYRTIAPDQRGYSPGARPKGDDSYRIVGLAQDVIAIADALELPVFHLIGHDWGGAVAWLVAKFVPNRALSLTSVSTPHPTAMKLALEDPHSCQHNASAYMDDAARPGAAERLVREGVNFFPDRYTDRPPDLSAYEELLSDREAVDAMLAWYRANIEDRKLNTPSLGETETPALLVFGEDEQYFCRDTAEASARYVKAPFRFVLLHGTGHWICDQKPDELAREVLPHLRMNRGRVAGSVPFGPDLERPLKSGWSGHACRGAPRFELTSELAACSHGCPASHCLPAELTTGSASLLPDCGAGEKCVPDALSSVLGRVSFAPCKTWLGSGAAACVPTCMVGLLGAILGRDGCGEQEVCAPCVNPLDGKPTGACADLCQGL